MELLKKIDEASFQQQGRLKRPEKHLQWGGGVMAKLHQNKRIPEEPKITKEV